MLLKTKLQVKDTQPEKGKIYHICYRGTYLSGMYGAVLDPTIHFDHEVGLDYVWAALATGNPNGVTMTNQAFRLYLVDILDTLELKGQDDE